MSETSDVEREDLWRQYGHSLDEYRFQVQLNWDRTRYLLTLDVGIIPAATALLGLADASRLLVAAVYLAGVLISVLGPVTLSTQRDYYRATRSLKARLEDELMLGHRAIRTTPGMGQTKKRRMVSVHQVHMASFVVIGVVHLSGIVVALR